MSLDYLKSLLGGQIQKIDQPFPHQIIMDVYHPSERKRWVFSAHPQVPRITPTLKTFPNPKVPPVFCLWLRTRLLWATFEEISSLHDQGIQFHLRHHQALFFLIWEANGTYSNLLLLDAERQLQMALVNPNQPGRALAQGVSYTLPTQWTPGLPFPSVSSLEQLDQHFWSLEQEADLAQRRRLYQKHLKTLSQKISRRLEKQKIDLEKSTHWEHYEHCGELLKSHLNQWAPGQSRLTVTNYFDPELTPITLPLKPELTSQANLQSFFHKAQKYKKALPHIETRILQTLEELEQIQIRQQQLLSLNSWESFQQWEAALPRFLKNTAASRRSSPVVSVSAPLARLSSEGHLILVGRNQNQNDQVTFEMAQGNDWWLHVQGMGGSHVVVKCPQEILPPTTLQEAAQLAAYYSKGRHQGHVAVDYTQRKYVKKLKGAKPGTVTISQNKSLWVDINETLVQELLNRTSG